MNQRSHQALHTILLIALGSAVTCQDEPAGAVSSSKLQIHVSSHAGRAVALGLLPPSCCCCFGVVFDFVMQRLKEKGLVSLGNGLDS